MSGPLAHVRAQETAEQWLRRTLLPPWGERDGCRAAVLLAYEAGSRAAADARPGQESVDTAIPLIAEAAQLFRTYEQHHREKISGLAGRPLEAVLAKADRNARMAVKLEAWLRGDHYRRLDDRACRVDPADISNDTEGSAGRTPEDCDARFANVPNVGTYQSHEQVPVRLNTPDPRFDPAQPVFVNGFLFHPATED